MSQLSTAELPLLHQLRLLGSAMPGGLAERTGLSEIAAERALARLQADGLARTRGRSGHWVLTEQGRKEIEATLARELERLDGAAAIERCYEAFLGLNPKVLELCTEWQLREVDGELVTNDHRDSIHDRWVVTRLQATHREARPTLVALADAAPWFEGYADRLDHALDRVLSGRHEWLDSPGVDSYHSVWFELHENLLATLGRDRHQETALGSDNDDDQPDEGSLS